MDWQEIDVRKIGLAIAVCLGIMAGSAWAQQMDVAFGAGTVSELSSSSSIASFGGPPVSLNGGTYLNFSGDYIFYRGIFGAGGELGWRASRSDYLGIPYRPFFYDFNGIFAPKLGKSVTAQLMAGIGGEDVRFYNPAGGCGLGCTNFVSTQHFMGHFGAGLSFYVHGNFFVRPEAHIYLVHNNDEFTTGSPARYGVSIGYSFGRP
jgi:hypothetical protein